jgi:16S rRNA (adenine1518-N6/adenine1519-N6)-dimethyltransferase
MRYDEGQRSMRKSRRHALGQHFLASKPVLAKIVAAIDPRPGEVIVEIGAGKGALTAALAEKAGRVIALEKDDRLIPGLREILPPNVEVVHADVLRFDFRALARALADPIGGRPLRLAGNVPYSISTPLLFKVLDDRDVVADAAFLLQKEVAERVTAKPGTKSYGPLGILFQNEFEAHIAFAVAPGSFLPPPKVQSSLLVLRRRDAPVHPGGADEPFRAFLRAAFGERRKMLRKNLSRLAAPDRLDGAYAALGIARTARAEELPAGALFALFDALRLR